jgi:hypothetical protein
VAHGAGVSGSWQTTSVPVPRRVPADRLGEVAIHLLHGRLEREGVDIAFVGVLRIPEVKDDSGSGESA